MFGDGIHEDHAPVHVGRDDGVADAVERRLQPLALLCQRLLGPPLVGDVAEHEHDAEHAAGAITDRRRAVGNGTLRSVAGDQHGVVGEADDVSEFQDQAGRVLDQLASLLVDDGEDVLQRSTDRLLL